jgi:hypothetical protein
VDSHSPVCLCRYQKIIDPNQLKTAIVHSLEGDCNGIFSTSPDRKQIKLYYDGRNAAHTVKYDQLTTEEFHAQREKDEVERFRLMNDPTDLLQDLENGMTVCIVFGTDEFTEHYYVKLNGMYLQTTVDHSINW